MVVFAFASDRPACSIFVPAILGMNVTLLCIVPPGPSLDTLQEGWERVKCRTTTLSLLPGEPFVVLYKLLTTSFVSHAGINAKETPTQQKIDNPPTVTHPIPLFINPAGIHDVLKLLEHSVRT